ncbi:NTP transferase domain-containing protein [Candidatus Uhrbacteria bacterium]|nr:NTP transferase domain-containing protein [Candidatus Uhrbacteria bacterium]
MQAVILAAGKGARLRPLTDTVPKPLILIGQKPLLLHVLEVLPDAIDEIFIVVNHLQQQIIETIGPVWKNIPVTYIFQESLDGTAGALTHVKEHLSNSFLVLNADNLYAKADLEQLIDHKWSILVSPLNHTLKAAAQDQEQRFTGLGPGNLAVCGAYVLGMDFFNAPLVEIQVQTHHEFGLPQTLATTTDQHTIHTIHATFWHQVGTHEELDRARLLV